MRKTNKQHLGKVSSPQNSFYAPWYRFFKSNSTGGVEHHSFKKYSLTWYFDHKIFYLCSTGLRFGGHNIWLTAIWSIKSLSDPSVVGGTCICLDSPPIYSGFSYNLSVACSIYMVLAFLQRVKWADRYHSHVCALSLYVTIITQLDM